MTRHIQQDEMLLRSAIEALRTEEPDAVQISAAAERVADRLGLSGMNATAQVIAIDRIEQIASCGDVQRHRSAYRAGNLSNSQTLLIEAHLRDCGSCFRAYHSGSEGVLDWSTPAAAQGWRVKPRALAWAMAPIAAVLACSFFIYQAYWQVPPGVRAEVQSIDGSAYRISGSGDRQLMPGDKLADGEQVRTSGGAHAVVRLSDGSTVELNERTVMGVGARGHNMTVSLDNGAVIVDAAKRESGHLYVNTPDCHVAVTGTVFSVNSGIKGSRVAVLQGAVEVRHAGQDSVVHAGDQISTNDNLSPAPVAQQIAWSHDRARYLTVLAQLNILQHKLDAIPFPGPRYTSDLLTRVPADTLLYISIPNLGDYLSQANKVFQDQLQQSPALQQWWDSGQGHNTAELDMLVDTLHQMSQYLGNEVVIVGEKQADDPAFAILADVQKSGLDDFLKTQLPFSGSNAPLTVFDETTLSAATDSGRDQHHGYALVRPHEAVFSNSIATLKQMNAQLNASASGFATGDFGQQVAAAYSRGAGVILAADLHAMMQGKAGALHMKHGNNIVLQNSGMEDVRYLIAEHRELNGEPQNHLNLQFTGARQRVASWLGAPAPMGSLNFVTPNAAVVVAGLTKDPKTIADDLLAMVASDDEQGKKLKEAEAKLHINFRDDLAAQLGGDFLISLDGPVLPTPSWKAVIEVNDADKLEQTLERLTESINEQMTGDKAHKVAIESSVDGAQRFYAVRDVTLDHVVAQYVFFEGYMVVAPDRALLMQALSTHQSGDSLARSSAFKALLPKDENENYSAIAYQNLSPVLTPLLSQLSGKTATALQQLASDARPTTICAWGKDTRIEAASDSHLFGFDFLTLGTLLNSRNKQALNSVRN